MPEEDLNNRDEVREALMEANRLMQEKKAVGWTKQDFANGLKHLFACCPSSSFCRKHPLLRNKRKK